MQLQYIVSPNSFTYDFIWPAKCKTSSRNLQMYLNIIQSLPLTFLLIFLLGLGVSHYHHQRPFGIFSAVITTRQAGAWAQQARRQRQASKDIGRGGHFTAARLQLSGVHQNCLQGTFSWQREREQEEEEREEGETDVPPTPHPQEQWTWLLQCERGGSRGESERLCGWWGNAPPVGTEVALTESRWLLPPQMHRTWQCRNDNEKSLLSKTLRLQWKT